jgi:hypothetical protein
MSARASTPGRFRRYFPFAAFPPDWLVSVANFYPLSTRPTSDSVDTTPSAFNRHSKPVPGEPVMGS